MKEELEKFEDFVDDEEEKVANVLYNYAKKVKGKKNNPKSTKSTYKNPTKTCIITKSKKKGIN